MKVTKRLVPAGVHLFVTFETTNRKTAKKFGQNRKPHTKPSKTDTMVTSGAYRAN